MINVDFSYNFILGCFVGVVGVGIYSIRFLNPRIAEEKDVFLSTLFFIYSGIIIIHGWRLDPILFLSQILIVTLSINFLIENLNLKLKLLKKQNKKVIKESIGNDVVKEVYFDAGTEEATDIFNIFR